MRWILVLAVATSACAQIRAATNHPPSRQQLGQFTPEEIEAERQSRARFAAGMGAFGAGLQQQHQQPAAYQEPACTNDYSCQYGWVCVKANYAAEGTCMQAVDRNGVPTYQGPSSKSIVPKLPSTSDCSYDSQCPAGFRCSSGTCVK